MISVSPEIDWHAVFETAPVAMSIIDVHGRQVAGNAAYAALLGYSREELDALDVGKLTRPEDQTWTSTYLARLVSGEDDQFVTVKRYSRRDGSELYARLTAIAMRGTDGSCHGLLGTIVPVDLHERIDDARIRNFLAYAESGFTIVDATGAVLESSGRYRELLGYPPTFWETRTVFDLLPADQKPAAEDFRERLALHPGVEQELEVQLLAADGSINDFLIQGINLLDDPEVAGVVLSSLNVTEQRRLVAGLVQRRDSAEAVAEAQTLLLATVSHELRNPLHAIEGLAELLAAESLPPRAAELADALSRQLTGLAHVTEDLLDTARLDAGTIELHLTPTDIRALIDEIVDYGRVAVGKRPLVVASAVAASVPSWVLADTPRLRQILRNLVGNAVKFTPSGSVVLDVRLGMDDLLSFSVIDNGVGIPPEEINAILQPFRTGSTAGASKGAGLGLAIVQRLATAMGGTLHITSEIGRGATFRLDVPLATTNAAVPTTVATGPETTANLASPIFVLVVEDNPVNQHLARSQLDKLGMTAIIVGSGEEGLALLSAPDRPAIDVVLMDQQLPGIDGVETARRIRLLEPSMAGVPIIGLTASAGVADRKTFLDAGLDGFIAKPATLEDIRRAIVDSLPARASRLGAAGRSTANEVADSSVQSAKAHASASPMLVEEAAPPVPPPTEPPPPNLDTGVLSRLADEFGDRSVVEGLVGSFLTELPKRSDALCDALRSGDRTAAARAAHMLKSSARLLGAAALADVCFQVEKGAELAPSAVTGILSDTALALLSWQGTLEASEPVKL